MNLMKTLILTGSCPSCLFVCPTDGEYLFVDPDNKLGKYAPKGWKSSHASVSTLLFLFFFAIHRSEETAHLELVAKSFLFQDASGFQIPGTVVKVEGSAAGRLGLDLIECRSGDDGRLAGPVAINFVYHADRHHDEGGVIFRSAPTRAAGV